MGEGRQGGGVPSCIQHMNGGDTRRWVEREGVGEEDYCCGRLEEKMLNKTNITASRNLLCFTERKMKNMIPSLFLNLNQREICFLFF